MYMVEMAERNGMTLEEINIVGHKFTKEWNQAPEWDPSFLDVKKKLAEELAKNMQGGGNQGFNNGGSSGNDGFGGGNHGFSGGNQGFSGGNQGFSGGNQGFSNHPSHHPAK